MASWTSSFENSPSQSGDPIADGATEIQNTRSETRLRAETEHDWGPNTSGDDGAHLEGSARVFVGTSDPSTLNDPNSTALDEGRVAVRTDRTNQALVRTGGAWAPISAGVITALTESTITGLTAADFTGTVAHASDTLRTLMSDGSSWVVIGRQFRGARARKTGNQTIANTTVTTLSWDVEDVDVGGFFDLGSDNTIITIPSGVDRVVLKAQIVWDTSTMGNSFRQVVLRDASTNSQINGGGEDIHQGEGTTGIVHGFSTGPLSVASGDTFEVVVQHNDGGNLDVVGSVSTWLSIEVLE